MAMDESFKNSKDEIAKMIYVKIDYKKYSGSYEKEFQTRWDWVSAIYFQKMP